MARQSPHLIIVTMGATMFLEVQNDGEGPAVRSADAERRAVAAAVAAAAGAGGGRHRLAGGPANGSGSDVEVVSLEQRSGPELTLAGVLRARDAALQAVAAARLAASATATTATTATAAATEQARAEQAAVCCYPVVFVTGTDCLEEFALALDYLLPRGGGGGRRRRRPLPAAQAAGDAGSGGAPAAAAPKHLAAAATPVAAAPVAAAAPDYLAATPRLACVVTGAMRPASALSPDGPANLADALVAARDMAARDVAARRLGRLYGARPGVLVAMGGLLHAARHVRKVCSDGTAGTAFSSGPGAGPVGAVGSGRVTWADGRGPPPPARVPRWGGWRGGGGGGGSGDGDEDEDEDEDGVEEGEEGEGGGEGARASSAPPPRPPPPPPLVLAVSEARGDLRTRVPIWTLTCDAAAPPEALLDASDGLVLAAPGAGSVAGAVQAALGPAARARGLPVVLVSRCGAGPCHDAGLYGRRSALKYSAEGFETGCRSAAGSVRLNPVQARLALSVALTLRAADARRRRERAAAGAAGTAAAPG